MTLQTLTVIKIIVILLLYDRLFAKSLVLLFDTCLFVCVSTAMDVAFLQGDMIHWRLVPKDQLTHS